MFKWFFRSKRKKPSRSSNSSPTTTPKIVQERPVAQATAKSPEKAPIKSSPDRPDRSSQKKRDIKKTKTTKHLKVVRFKKDSTTTISRIYLNGKFLCHGLEDAYRKTKVRGHTRIPAGTYVMGLHPSPKFMGVYKKRWLDHKELLHVLNVPNFEYILWHIGNTHEDTDGCLLLGNYRKGNFIHNSRVTYIRVYRLIYPLVKKGYVTVEYVDED